MPADQCCELGKAKNSQIPGATHSSEISEYQVHREILSQKSKVELGLVTETFSPRTWEAEAGAFTYQSSPGARGEHTH